MKKVIRNIKIGMLRLQIERCKIKQSNLDVEATRYHKEIIKAIEKGDSHNRIEKLKIERRKTVNESFRLIHKEYNLSMQLLGA